jgi:DNA-binding HxlR family transcriptional regulator
MNYDKYSQGPCPIARALLRVGDSWTMLILRNASWGETRFDQFLKGLGISPNILTRRLGDLTDAGLLERRRYSERPPRDEYVLTPRGHELIPILQALGAWGAKHYGEGGTSRLVDAVSGKKVTPIVVDAVSGKPMSELETRVAPPARRA